MTPQLGLFDREPTPHDHDAVLSPCGTYRYTLTRRWDRNKHLAAFLCLNPSTADADTDDNTIKRCVSFAKRWDAGGIIVVNLYAYRATDPRFLAVGNPVLPANAQGIIGPDNDRHLRNTFSVVNNIVCAWGAFPFAKERAHEVLAMVPKGVEVTCLGVTKDGSPKHPLYLAADTKRVPFDLTTVHRCGNCRAAQTPGETWAPVTVPWSAEPLRLCPACLARGVESGILVPKEAVSK